MVTMFPGDLELVAVALEMPKRYGANNKISLQAHLIIRRLITMKQATRFWIGSQLIGIVFAH